MHGLIYLVGLIVVILAVLSFFGLPLSARAQRICHVTDLWNGSGRH